MKKNKKGIALISVFFVIALLVIYGIAIFSISLNEWTQARRQKDRMRAYFMARAGLTKVTMDIYNAFRTSPDGWSPQAGTGSFSWFSSSLPARADLFPNRVMFNTLTGFANETQNIGMFTVTLPQTTRADESAPGIRVTSGGAYVRLIAVGEAPASYLSSRGTVKEIITQTIFYGLGPSPVFKYAYFVNNYGWLWGGGITVNGDVRSNGNFDFNGNPEVNGDIYAARNDELPALGDITGKNKNVTTSQYHQQAPATARPTDPTDPNNPDDTTYEGGYTGQSIRHPNQNVLEMPYLGDLQTYKDLAQHENGTITQADAATGEIVTLVDNVYTGNGPDGIPGTPDDGCMVLIGTAARPIVISGPVVINKDIAIKGVVQGQGIIYAGRNVHIIGDLTYKTAPSWPKPDTNPDATGAINKTRDCMGLACKGNVIVGDYTTQAWKNAVVGFLKPPFTKGYTIDATDAPLGYDTDSGPDYFFNGDYTANDGGKKNDNSDRKFYEATLTDTTIHNNADNQVNRVDAVVYNNHAVTGKVGAFSLNGAMVCRDEAIAYTGSVKFSYDMRINPDGKEFIDIHLPRDLALPTAKGLAKLKKN